MLPARKPRDRSVDEEALLIRSAESLGRVIGQLQRQIDKVTRQVAAGSRDVTRATPRTRKAKGTRTAKGTRAARSASQRSTERKQTTRRRTKH